MASINVNNFLLSLAVAMAAKTQGQSSPLSPLVFATSDPTVSRSLFLHEIPQGDRTLQTVGVQSPADPATALRMYGGASPEGLVRRLMISLQQWTRGTQAAAVLAQAWQVHETLLADAGWPVNQWAIPGKRISSQGAIEVDPDQDWIVKLAMPLQTPGIVGRDETGLYWLASCNWDIEFLWAAKS